MSRFFNLRFFNLLTSEDFNQNRFFNLFDNKDYDINRFFNLLIESEFDQTRFFNLLEATDIDTSRFFNLLEKMDIDQDRFFNLMLTLFGAYLQFEVLRFFNLAFSALRFFNLRFFNLRFFNLHFFNLDDNAKNNKGAKMRAQNSDVWGALETPWNVEAVFPDGYVGDDINGDVDVAILDTGVDTSHPDLAGQVEWTYDATGEGFYDYNGHGTHVAGTIAALRDGSGVVGVAPNVDLYALKVIAETNDEQGEWEWLEDAIYKAVAGPDGEVGTADDTEVINMSFGSGDEAPTQGVRDAIAYAHAQGVTLVAAAGNRGDGDTSTTELNYPAALPEVIAVGASDIADRLTSFSSSADYLEFAAPGDMILSTYLDGGYAVWGGTSMSTPHVTGLTALVYATQGHLPVGNFDDLGQDTVRGILHGYAVDQGTSGWDAGYGYGIAAHAYS